MALEDKFKVKVGTWTSLVKEAEIRLHQLDSIVDQYESKKNEINRFIGEDDDDYEKILTVIGEYLERIREQRERVVENINTLNDMIGVAHIYKGTSEAMGVFEKGLKLAGI